MTGFPDQNELLKVTLCPKPRGVLEVKWPQIFMKKSIDQTIDMPKIKDVYAALKRPFYTNFLLDNWSVYDSFQFKLHWIEVQTGTKCSS